MNTLFVRAFNALTVRPDRGADASEYAVLAVMAVGIVVAIGALTGAIAGAFTNAGSTIESA